MGAHFEALDEGVLMAVLKSFEHFFAISNSAAALWEGWKFVSWLCDPFTLDGTRKDEEI